MTTVLVVGYNTRHICQSAKQAGFTVYALEHYGDRDLFEVADKVQLFQDLKGLYKALKCFEHYDFLVCGPGFETWRPDNTTPVLNNDTKLIKQVSDKYWLSEYLGEKGIKHPRTWLVEEVDASKMAYPLMLKPRWGAGGIDNRVVWERRELEEIQDTCNGFIVQEYLPGKTTSVSLIATGEGQARSIATSEQIQLTKLPDMPYAYQGNVTPYHGRHTKDMETLAEHIAVDLGLTGSNGVDFLVTSKGLFVLEVNPRFQGTLETVERAYSVNVFNMHFDAFNKKTLPEPRMARRFAAKTVVFAENPTRIPKSLSDFLYKCHRESWAADIPHEDTLIQRNKPIVTLFATGNTREGALRKLKTLDNTLRSKIAHIATSS